MWVPAHVGITGNEMRLGWLLAPTAVTSVMNPQFHVTPGLGKKRNMKRLT